MSSDGETTTGRPIARDASSGQTDGSRPETEDLQRRLRRLDRLAELLDDQFRIPFTNRRVGIDPIIGLLPGGGDWVAWIAGAYILGAAARLNVPPTMLLRMAGYLGIDLLGGYVPILGDLFDAAYKSNRKNVELLFDHFEYEPGRRTPVRQPEGPTKSPYSTWKTYALATGLILLLGALAAGPILLAWWLFGG